MFSTVKPAKLSFRYGAMSAGKSLALLQIAHNYAELGRQVHIFTAAKDDRYGQGKVTSRLGVQKEASLYTDTTDFLAQASNLLSVSAVLVDEAQFLTKSQVSQLHQIAAVHGIPVICFGLRSDFQGNAFPGAEQLLTLAEEIIELKTICKCGRKATMNIRLDEQGNRVREGQQVAIGGNSQYQSVCASCFYTN